MAKPKDYEVGYRKPPKGSRFRTGQSGNPKGRPKRQLNVRADIEAAFSEMVPIKENGQVTYVSYPVAAMKALFAQVVKGNPRATMAFFQLLMAFLPSSPPSQENGATEDEEFLRRFEERIAKRLKRDQEGSNE
jgi:hypothetical protein